MKTVLVPLANDCEELEAITITDLLVRAGAQVTRASIHDTKEITASRGTKLVADSTINSLVDQKYDLIALPGGLPGANHLMDSEILNKMLQAQNQAEGWIGAICAAPKVLVNAGLVEGKTITCYPGALASMETDGVTITEQAVVKDQHIITSRGPGTAMDFALALIEVLYGPEKRQEVETPLVR